MAEYIERNKVLAKAAPVEGCFSDMISAYDVASIPAADVVEVVHARWEYHGRDDDCELYGFCTNCHRGNMTEDDIERLKPIYCPNCGARMDGAE